MTHECDPSNLNAESTLIVNHVLRCFCDASSVAELKRVSRLAAQFKLDRVHVAAIQALYWSRLTEMSPAKKDGES